MTTQEYESMAAREATASASSRLFSFSRIRSGGAPKRFYPGEGTRLHFANRDVDTLELPGLPSGYLAAGDVVTATYKGVCVFRGDVANIVEHNGRGTDATQTVTCVGPWSKMARLVYRQGWWTGSGYSLSSRLVLNQTQGGLAQNLNSELREIAQHGATACGYTVANNDISVSTQQLPFDECRDITVADAIKRELRFFPKAVVYFDYSSTPPALKIEGSGQRVEGSLQSAAYVADVPKTAREYAYNAHPITGVDLEIESSGTVDGVEYRQITHQTAGNTLAGNPDCLYATLQIKGASSSATRQSFKSVTEDLPANLNDASWWKQKHPRLANVAASAITISNATRTIADAACVRIAKSTAGELEEAGLKCEVSKFTATATIETTDDKEETIYLTLNFLMTNATTKTYTWVAESSGESGETVPSGLAATILSERSGTLQGERMTVRLGDTFPRVGDALVESSIASASASSRAETLFLQQIDIDCADLTADLSFGVPEYLTPEDMASLLSGFRNKRTSTSATIRKTGKTTDGGADVEMGGIAPLSSSEFAPGTKAKTTIKSGGQSSESGGSIKLDSSEVASGKTISVHTLKIKSSSASASSSSSSSGSEEQEYQILSEEDIEIDTGAGTTSGVESVNGLDGAVQVASDTLEVYEDDENGEILIDGVGSVNGADGALTIVGEGKIKVTTDGKTIKISLEEGDGEDDGEDEDENNKKDPCEHPGSGGEGGVAAGSDGGGGSGGAGGWVYGGGGGGVPADGESHPGNPCTGC